VKAGNHQDAVGFNLVKQAVWKATYRSPSSPPVNNRKAQRKFPNELNGGFHRLDESLG